MSLIRKNNSEKSKIGIKKIANVQYETKNTKNSETKENIPIDLNPVPKTTLVSGIVDQLIQGGYSGDLTKNIGMQRNTSDIQEAYIAEEMEENESESEEDLIIKDINVEEQKTKPKKKVLSAAEIKKREAAFYEDRTKASQEQINIVNKNARVLYKHIDSFISSLRESAEKTQDNPQLRRKLENLRRLCVGFVRSAEQQMPHHATSLFVTPSEENKNV